MVSTVDNCNDKNGLVKMTATLRNVSGDYGQATNGVISFNADQLSSSFSEDGQFLIMTKVLGGEGCTKIEVDGVKVCTEVDETITLQCKYSLDDVEVDDSFAVTGQDSIATAENIGTLTYTLTVEDNKSIGDEIKFTVTPTNPNLVFATIKACHVTRNKQELTIVGHGDVAKCTNPVIDAKAVTDFFSSQGPIQGAWTAFKWSTDADDNIETQGLSCTIGLSKDQNTAAVEPCKASNN